MGSCHQPEAQRSASEHLQGLLQEHRDVAAAVDPEVQWAFGEAQTALVPEGNLGLEDTILEERHRAYSGIQDPADNQGVQSVHHRVGRSLGTVVAEDSREELGEEVEIVAVAESMDPEEGLVETCSVKGGQ